MSLHFRLPVDDAASTAFAGVVLKSASAIHCFRRAASIAEDHRTFAALYAADVAVRLAGRGLLNNLRKTQL